MKKRLLVVEDDPNLGLLLQDHLEDNDFEVIRCTDGEMAKDTVFKHEFDLAVIDVMLPKLDGFSLVNFIRESNLDLPVIFLTAKSMKDDRIHGLKLGADDYVTKPFSMEELYLRIKAVLKRNGTNKSFKSGSKYTLGSYTFDADRQILTRGLDERKVTSKESALLETFCRHANEAIDRDIVLKEIWGDDTYYNARSMDVYISKLRKYLRDDPQLEIINIHGRGYKLLIKELT